MRVSLALRVFGLSFFLFVIPLIICFSFIIYFDYKNLVDEAIRALRVSGLHRAAVFNSMNKSHEEVARLAITLVGADNLYKASSDPQLLKTVQQQLQNIAVEGDYIEVYFAQRQPDDSIKNVVSSNAVNNGTLLPRNQRIRQSLALGDAESISWDPETTEGFYTYLKTVPNPSGAPATGVMAFAQNMTDILKNIILFEDLPFAYRVDISLVSPEGVIVASSNLALQWEVTQHYSEEDFRALTLSSQYQGLPLRNSGITFKSFPSRTDAQDMIFAGHSYFAVTEMVPTTELSLLMTTRYSDIVGAEVNHALKVLLAIAIVFVFSGAVSLVLTIHLARPLNQLCLVMQNVSRGMTKERFFPTKFGFEINTVGMIFNQTLDTLLITQKMAEEERVHKETIQHELIIGQEIQRQLLPQKMPEMAGIDLAARYLGAKEVSGDFYDVLVQKEEGGAKKLCLAVADGSGKGISACLFALGLRGLFRSALVQGMSLAEMVRSSNDLFREDTGDSGMFATAFCAMFDPLTGILEYVSCGHNPVLLCREDGSIETLTTPGIALGVIEIKEVQIARVQLKPKDVVVLYTDGIPEALDPEQKLFGMPRFLELVKRDHLNTATVVADRIISSVQQYMGSAPQADDITLLILRYSPYNAS